MKRGAGRVLRHFLLWIFLEEGQGLVAVLACGDSGTQPFQDFQVFEHMVLWEPWGLEEAGHGLVCSRDLPGASKGGEASYVCDGCVAVMRWSCGSPGVAVLVYGLCQKVVHDITRWWFVVIFQCISGGFVDGHLSWGPSGLPQVYPVLPVRRDGADE